LAALFFVVLRAAAFLAAPLLAADLAERLLGRAAAVFLAAVFLAAVFLAADFLAAVFFAAGFRDAVLGAAAFFARVAPGFFAATVRALAALRAFVTRGVALVFG
jgi:hypothetical protein